MVVLTCKSIDNLGYEDESLEFYYGKTLIFQQQNSYLNRGGKTLELYDIATNSIVISSGRYTRGEDWIKKMIKSMNELGFTIELNSVVEAIQLRKKQNIENQLKVLKSEQKLLHNDLLDFEKRISNIKKRQKELRGEIIILENKL